MNFQVHCPVCSGEFDVEDRLDDDNPRTPVPQCPWCGAEVGREDASDHDLELPVSGFHVQEPNDSDLLEADLLELEEPSPDANFARTDSETSPSDPRTYSSSNDNEVELAPVAEPPAMAWNQMAARPRPLPKQQSALRKLLPPVLGGLTAIPIAIGILWYGFGRDLGNAGPTVARYVPWIVPKHLRGRSAGYANRWNSNSTANKPTNQEKKPNLDAGEFGKIGGGLSDPQTPKMKSATTGSGVFGGMGMGSGSSSQGAAPKPSIQTEPDNQSSPYISETRSDPASSNEEDIAMNVVAEASPTEDPDSPVEMIDHDVTMADEQSMDPMPSEPDESPLPSVRADSEQEMRIKPDDDLIPTDFGDSPTEGTPTESMPSAEVVEGAEEPIVASPYAALIDTETEELLKKISTSLDHTPENLMPDSPSLTQEDSLNGELLCRQLTRLVIGLEAVTGTPSEDKLRDRIGSLATRVLQSKPMRTAIEESSLNLIASVTPPEIGELSVWISDTLTPIGDEQITPIGDEQNGEVGETLVLESRPSLMLQARVARLVLDRNRTHTVERIPAADQPNPNPLEDHQTTRASKLVFGKLLQWDETECVVEIIAIFP